MGPIPTAIGRYFVENLVGIGGMGQIFKAHDPDIRRTVAIKLISTELMSGGSARNTFGAFAERLRQPPVVHIQT